ncbi:MAG: hypothetical protein KA313_01210 [Pseudarcicella sp.]|nr:hypothetical protein [Pseudarcicella sp.]MBP6409697.1 hypothetical protein [Pseudarcicella sp.]
MIAILTYIIYLIVSTYVAIIVGKKLHRDGSIWLESIVKEKSFSDKINNLLLMGYYLVNIGYIFYAIISFGELQTYSDILRVLSNKIGVILLILGYLHYQNLIFIYIFYNLNFIKKWKL